MLHAVRWPDKIRSPQELYSPVDVDEQEIEGALALMDTLARDDLEGEEFRGESRSPWPSARGPGMRHDAVAQGGRVGGPAYK